MTEKERLIELLKKGQAEYSERSLAEIQKLLYEKHRYNSATDKVGNLWDELADYLLANGVIVPPCKVGDVVYVLTCDSLTGIEKSRVKRIRLQELQDGTTLRITIPCVCDDWGNAVRIVYPEDFGKNIFLSREEAEAALERSRG